MNYKLLLKLIILIASFSFFSCQKMSDPENEYVNLRAFLYDYQARQAIEKKDKDRAHDKALKALEYQDATDLESNLGITYDMIEKKEDAEKSFLSALERSTSDTDKFKYLFNLGVLLDAQKKVPEALNYYQKALDLNPASTEVKHNIELLIQQQQQDQKNDKDKNKDGEGQPDKDKDPKDGKDGDKKDDQDQKDPKEDKGQDRKSNAKYKPRPFKGDQLTEGDVKKILGELSQQDQKIRSNFNKKEQRKEDKNEKDW